MALTVALATLREADPDLARARGILQELGREELLLQWLPVLRDRVLHCSWTAVLIAMRMWNLWPQLTGLSPGRNRRIVRALLFSDLAVTLGSMLAGARGQACSAECLQAVPRENCRDCRCPEPPTPPPPPPPFLHPLEVCSPRDEELQISEWDRPLLLILPLILVMGLFCLLMIRLEMARRSAPVRERLELCRYLRGGGSLAKLAEATFLSLEQVVLQLISLEEEVGQVVQDAAEVTALAGISTPLLLSEDEEEEEEEAVRKLS